MTHPICIFSGQWADLPLEVFAKKAADFGYDGLELGCWGDHFDVQAALSDDGYCQRLWDVLEQAGIGAYAISTHLVGQCVCDPVDARHESILPPEIWGDGDPEGVRRRAAKELADTARAARKFFDLAPPKVKERLALTGRTVVNGFTGSKIWHLMYGFPPITPVQIEDGYADFATRFKPIMDVYESEGVHFALEVHPTEIAFDIVTARRTLEAIGHHPNFGFNFDPSHFAYQNVDYHAFIEEFCGRIFNVHVKDVWWAEGPMPIGTFGGHTDFGTEGRSWDFRSPGRGRVDFEGLMRRLNHGNYQGPLTVEWEDPMMDREYGAKEAAVFTRALDFPLSAAAPDSVFADPH